MSRGGLLAAMALAGALWTAPAEADAEKFIVTIRKVELKTVDGRWITVLEPDKEVDLVSAEPTVSFFNNQGRVPAGRYSNFRLTLSEMIRFSGYDKRHFTREGGRSRLVGAASRASELPGEFTAFEESSPTLGEVLPPGTVTQHLDLDAGDGDDFMRLFAKHDFPTPLEIKKGSFVKLWFNLEIETAVHYAWPDAFAAGVPGGGAMYALPPVQVSEFSVVVDDREETLRPESVVLEF